MLVYVRSAVLTNAEACDLRAANGAVSEGWAETSGEHRYGLNYVIDIDNAVMVDVRSLTFL